MRSIRYKARILISNLLIFIFTMILIIFVSSQIFWYYSISNIKDTLLQTSTNINLYIQEKTALLANDDDRAAYFFSNAGDIYNVVINYSTCQLELFSYDGKLLSYDSTNIEPTYMNAEYEMSLARQEPVMSIRHNNGIKQLWIMSPIKTKTATIIGFIGLIIPLTSSDSLHTLLLITLISCTFLGGIFLIIATTKFSDNFIKPIKTLTKISTEINKGQYDKIIHYKKSDEIGDLTKVYNDMTQNINKVITQLKEERKRLGNVLAALDDGLLALDKNGDVITSNKYIKTYFDMTEPKSIEDFKDYDFIEDIFRALKEGKSSISEEVEVNGRILLISGSPIREDNRLDENYLIIFRNITTARTLEQEQRKFISSVSHELRTPLTTIIGFSDFLIRRNITDPEKLNSSLSTINKEGQRLVLLVDDLLNANSLDQMVFSVHLKELDLEKLLLQVVEQMRIKSLEKEIEIQYRIEENLPEVLGDYGRLQQVFINIIHNAIKFSNVGGIIDLIATQEDDFINISIRDYGIGIDPAKKDFIFSAFYRTDESRTRNEGEGGAGLGLYLVKQIVDKHNGRIQVDSELYEGTNITVKLPIHMKEESEDITDVESLEEFDE